VGRKPSFECLGLRGLKAFGVVNSVDDCHKHGFTVPSSGDCAEARHPLLAHPTVDGSGVSQPFLIETGTPLEHLRRSPRLSQRQLFASLASCQQLRPNVRRHDRRFTALSTRAQWTVWSSDTRASRCYRLISG
jgi:hypothetical protein